MIEALVPAYLVAALATAVIAWTLSKKLGHHRRPASALVPVSLVAGLLWPLVLLGVLEIGSLAVLRAAVSSDRGTPVHA